MGLSCGYSSLTKLRICASRGVKLYVESGVYRILLILIFCLYWVNVCLCSMRFAGVQSILSALVFRRNPLLLGIGYFSVRSLFSMAEPGRVLIRMYYFVCVVITALFVIYVSPRITLLSRLSFVCFTQLCTVLLIFLFELIMIKNNRLCIGLNDDLFHMMSFRPWSILYAHSSCRRTFSLCFCLFAVFLYFVYNNKWNKKSVLPFKIINISI